MVHGADLDVSRGVPEIGVGRAISSPDRTTCRSGVQRDRRAQSVVLWRFTDGARRVRWLAVGGRDGEGRRLGIDGSFKAPSLRGGRLAVFSRRTVRSRLRSERGER
jgi:hypothetical protein